MKKQMISKIASALMIVLLALAALPTQYAHAATKSWVGTTGGAWTTSGNWNPSGAPAAGDDVTIPADQSAAITAIPTISLNSLTINGTCNLQSDAGLAQSRTMTVTGTLSVAGGKTLTFGTNNSGRFDFTLAATATGNISGTVYMNSYSGGGFDRTFTNSGNLTIASAGLITGQNASIFVQSSGATLQIGSIAGITTSGATGNIQVPGTRTYNAGANYVYNGAAAQNTGNGFPNNLTGSLTINNSAGVTLVNAARTISSGGTLNLTAGTFAAGTNLSMASTSTINRNGGSMTGTLQGTGVYDVNYTGTSKTAGPELGGSGLRNVTVNLSSGLTLDQNRIPDGNITVTAGTLDLSTFTFNRSAAGGILTVSNGATLMIGGTNSMPTNYTTHTFGATSNIEYGGAAQAVANETYGNLVLSGTGVKTINNTFTVTTTMWIKGPGGAGNAQVHINPGFIVTAANLWLGDDGVIGIGEWGGTGCVVAGCNIRTTYFTGASTTGYVHVSSGASLPVTMNYFHAKGQGGSFSIDWSTGTETGNVGFNLYVVDANGKHKLNAQLIPSTGFTTHTPQDYHFAASGLALSGTITFYLEDMDFLGKTMLHGPFALDKVYGQRVIGTLTDWQQIQAECSQHQVYGKRCAGY